MFYNKVLRQFLRVYVLWKLNVKGRPRRSITKSPMFLVCDFLCSHVMEEVVKSLNELLYNS